MRTRALAGRRAALGIDDDVFRKSGLFVYLLGDGDSLLDVLEAHDPAVLGDDRAGVRVPRGKRLPRLDGLAVGGKQRRAVRNLVAFALAAVVVGDEHLSGPGDHHLFAFGVGDVADPPREPPRAV